MPGLLSDRRISLLMNLQIGYCRRAVAGVSAYAAQKGWLLEEMPATSEVQRRLELSQPMGIIAHVLDETLCQTLRKFSCPVVSISSTLEDLPFPAFDVNNTVVGELACDYFLNLSYSNFAFFGSSVAGFSRQREQSFARALAREGFDLDISHANYTLRPPYDHYLPGAEEETRRWLTSLPKPVAILCSNDEHARILSFLCQASAIPIPEEVALLGVDNDETICSLSSPPISSVDNPAEEIGFRAASALDSLLLGEKDIPERVSVPPIQIIERRSTERFATENPLARKAIGYIERNLKRNSLSIPDIADSLGVSRRRLERTVTSSLGLSALEIIHRYRTRKAQQLLRETDLSVETIASQCGFSNHRRLAIVFKAVTGLTPTGFRNFYSFDKI